MKQPKKDVLPHCQKVMIHLCFWSCYALGWDLLCSAVFTWATSHWYFIIMFLWKNYTKLPVKKSSSTSFFCRLFSDILQKNYFPQHIWVIVSVFKITSCFSTNFCDQYCNFAPNKTYFIKGWYTYDANFERGWKRIRQKRDVTWHRGVGVSECSGHLIFIFLY